MQIFSPMNYRMIQRLWFRGFSGRLAVPLCGLWLLVASGLSPAAEVNDPIMFMEEGQRAFDKGKFSEAAEQWQRALNHYREQSNGEAEIRTSISLAAACQAIGQHRRAVQTLESALACAKSSGAPSQLPLLKSRLGAALTMTREWERAAELLNSALEAARTARDLKLEGEILNDLGNLSCSQQWFMEALTYYDASAGAARHTGNAFLEAQARCNAAAAAAQSGEFARADELNAEALQKVAPLANSHAKSFLLLTSAQTDRQINLTAEGSAQRLILRAHRSFEQALELSDQLEDLPIKTYALGYLAQLYDEDGQRDAALALTRRAKFAAQQAQMSEALYRWEWQEGRILRAQGSNQPAIEAYRRAVQTLQPIRSDVSLGFGNTSRNQSFREAQGPLFLELADLLLLEARSATVPGTEQSLLREARDTVEHLKNVELNDYFCDDCVDFQRSRTRDLESVDDHTAVIYLVPLPTRTEVLVGLSSGLKRITVNVGAAELTAQVAQLRRNLETRTSYAYLSQAQQLYDWLIRPLRPWLGEHHINTLVFVPDGALRTIPLAALHDGEKFLIQDLAVAVVPGLSLVAPQAIISGKARLLLGGVSEAVQGFPPLDFVPAEMRELEPMYPSETILDKRFTLDELRRKLEKEQFSIIHIASHGQFDRDVRNTFVLTHDTKLTMNTLESLIRPSQYRGRPVELLVLSACQTAAGDDRAALGLAGVAVKAGARTVLASLWFVNDQSTSTLISEVYQELRRAPSVSKARALQAAQVKMLNDRRYRHPCYWSPFLIIGNWL
jgi:CHAT domain-containing protein